MYIRYWATTTASSQVSSIALAYLRSLIRIAPVRVIDPARMGPAVVEGEWARYANLFDTPMVGSMINVVCTQPSRWTWMQKISAPKTDDPACKEFEEIYGRAELYTEGVRNVLIVATRPATPDQVEAANRYESVICSEPSLQRDWVYTANGSGIVHVDPTNHRLIRIAVTGDIPPSQEI